MRLLGGLCTARPTFFLFLLLVLTIARVSADPLPDNSQGGASSVEINSNQVPASTTPSVTETTASPADTPSSTSELSPTSTTPTSTAPTTTSETTTPTPSTTTSTTSMATTTTTTSSTSTSTSTTTTDSTTSTSSSTPASGPIVTVPPTANAPYMRTTNIPEGTVFIAVGAILGLIGLALLAWRGMVAWSVNRSVRRAAMAQSADSKRLLRGSRKKRATVYTAAPAGDVSLEKLRPGTRSSVKPSRRGPSANSGLFFSPTASNTASAHNPAGNRGSTYLPAGYYATAGNSTPARSDTGGLSSPQGYAPSSPPMPPVGAYHDSPHGPRASYVAASTSSLNLNQPSQGRAPSAYLEDLFESHAPPRNSESGRR